MEKEQFEIDSKLGEINVVVDKIQAIGGVLLNIDEKEYFVVAANRTLLDELCPNYGEILINTGDKIIEILDDIRALNGDEKVPETER